jgi:hypothetical protein
MRKLLLFVILFFSLTVVHAQLNYRINQNGFKLMDGSKQIESPFWGGFNSPQFQHMDLNGDKLLDIIVFDRYDSKVMPFLRLENDVFQYAPEYEASLPKGLNYFKTADINSDGKWDIFTLSESSNLLIYIYQLYYQQMLVEYHHHSTNQLHQGQFRPYQIQYRLLA